MGQTDESPEISDEVNSAAERDREKSDAAVDLVAGNSVPFSSHLAIVNDFEW